MNEPSTILPIVFLWPLALLYEFAVFCRKLWYAAGMVKPYKAGVPVISIGNITAGGTGKTPMAIHVAQRLMNKGVRVAVLSRGYMRKITKPGSKTLVVSDGVSLRCSADEAGDEPYLMAIRLLGSAEKPGAMVIVGKDREATAKEAQRLGAQAIVLDDGFQHWRIKRDLDIVLLDSQRPFGNGWALPVGRLREPLASLQRADVFVFTRCESNRTPASAELRQASIPVFNTRHKTAGICQWRNGAYHDSPIDALKNKELLLFSGIARPDSFEHSVTQLGLRCGQHLRFGDHHRYSGKALRKIASAAQANDAVLTTEKDAVRLPREWDPGKPFYVLQVDIEFIGDAEKFKTMILSAVKTPPRPTS